VLILAGVWQVLLLFADTQGRKDDLALPATLLGAAEASRVAHAEQVGRVHVTASSFIAAEVSRRHQRRLMFRGMLGGGIFSCMLGFAMINRPRQTQEQREKRLQDYKASAPPDAPPLVEIPPPPDAVSISISSGMLSLFAPFFSTLLTVVVFAPVAVVSGAVAVMQGHAKGLIGVLLGIAGPTVWGLFVFFLYQKTTH
jgi:hypothetical protein